MPDINMNIFDEGQKLCILRHSLGYEDLERFAKASGIRLTHLEAIEEGKESMTADDYKLLNSKWGWAVKHVF